MSLVPARAAPADARPSVGCGEYVEPFAGFRVGRAAFPLSELRRNMQDRRVYRIAQLPAVPRAILEDQTASAARPRATSVTLITVSSPTDCPRSKTGCWSACW